MKTHRIIFLLVDLAIAFTFAAFPAAAGDDYANNLTAEIIIKNILKSELAQEYEITQKHRLYPYLSNYVHEAIQLAGQQGLLNAKASPENCVLAARIIVKIALKNNISRFIQKINPSIFGCIMAKIVKSRLKSADCALDKIAGGDGKSFSEKLAELNIQEEYLSKK